MPTLPRARDATVDVRKLVDYVLDPRHPRGRHKARVFATALGVTRQDAPWLQRAILRGVQAQPAAEVEVDRFGARWRVDVPLQRTGRRAVVRTLWLVADDTSPPRLVTCYIL